MKTIPGNSHLRPQCQDWFQQPQCQPLSQALEFQVQSHLPLLCQAQVQLRRPQRQAKTLWMQPHRRRLFRQRRRGERIERIKGEGFHGGRAFYRP